MRSDAGSSSARIRSPKPRFADSAELTLEAEPRFLGGAGDLSAGDLAALRAFVVRNLDSLLAYWNGTLALDDLCAKLQCAGDVPAALNTEETE